MRIIVHINSSHLVVNNVGLSTSSVLKFWGSLVHGILSFIPFLETSSFSNSNVYLRMFPFIAFVIVGFFLCWCFFSGSWSITTFLFC